MAASEHAERVVEAFSRLQRGLVNALLTTARPFDREYFKDLPDGSLEFEGERWSYRRHGAGVAFRSGRGVVVDAHVAMADWPGAIDGWRLCLYLESLGVQEMVYRGAVIAVAEESGAKRLLREMALAGVVRAVQDRQRSNRTYYVLMEG